MGRKPGVRDGTGRLGRGGGRRKAAGVKCPLRRKRK